MIDNNFGVITAGTLGAGALGYGVGAHKVSKILEGKNMLQFYLSHAVKAENADAYVKYCYANDLAEDVATEMPKNASTKEIKKAAEEATKKIKERIEKNGVPKKIKEHYENEYKNLKNVSKKLNKIKYRWALGAAALGFAATALLASIVKKSEK